VRDDGVGIPGDVLARGHKDGHFGMPGMRERAEKIGGAITVGSIPSGGTEVTLVLPARLAYARRGLRRPAWWPRFLRRSSRHG
jgi:nitrate/nitrite-specific signal transduction histidine kinase